MKLWHKRLAVGVVVTMGLMPAVVRAMITILPAALLVPDICLPVVGCITWTHSTELLQFQQVLAAIENLKLSPNAMTSIQMINGDIPTIRAAAAAAAPTHVGDAAAAAAQAQADADSKAAWMAGSGAADCTGALCAIQSDASVNMQTANNTAKANELHEQDKAQEVNVDNAFAGELTTEFGPGATCPVCQ